MKLKYSEGRSVHNCNFYNNWNAELGSSVDGLSEGFADDLTILFRMDVISLQFIIDTLNDFEKVSGLKLNVSKTQLLISGTEEYILGTKVCNITVVDRVKILGVSIDRKLERLSENWDGKIAKMIRLANFWKLQKLSITGRILVAKTYLLSQVIFLLETLPLDFDTGEQINKIMVDYVKGSDRVIAKNRWFLDCTLGGYGLIDIRYLNTCIKASWISRWKIFTESIDINSIVSGFRADLRVDQIIVSDYLRDHCPISYNIMLEWKSFRMALYRNKDNVGSACLLWNNALIEGKPNLGLVIFGDDRLRLLTQEARKVKIHQLCIENRIRPKEDIDTILGINLTLVEYFRLNTVINQLKTLYGEINDKGVDIEVYLSRKKRKGGALRRLVYGKNSSVFINNDPRRVPAASTLWGNDIVDESRTLIETNFGLWNDGKLSTEFRQFLFKFVQGRLYLNNVLARIDNDTVNKCTFCTIRAVRDLRERDIDINRPEYNIYLGLQPVETTLHLFWECDSVQNLIQKCFRWVMGLDWLNGREEILMSSYFRGIPNEWIQLTKVDLIWKHFVKFYIYQCRGRRCLPTFPNLKFELNSLFSRNCMQEYRSKIRQLWHLYN